MTFMSKIKEILADLGFEKKETDIYLSLIRNGSLSALQISKETGIDRTNVYDLLNKLIHKGIVSSISKNSTTHYSGLEPDKLSTYFKEKYSALDEALPELKNLRVDKNSDFICETFYGKEGLKIVLKDMLSSTKNYKVIGMREEYDAALGYFTDQGILKINENKIKETGIFEKGAKFKKTKNGVYKGVDKLSTPSSTIIYDDIVLFITWIEPYHIIRVKNKIFSKNQEENFNLLWNIK